MSFASRTGILGAILAASAIGDSSTMVLDPPRSAPDIAIPRSALGNGSRGHRNNKPTFDRARANRRRKFALQSKRRNRP